MRVTELYYQSSGKGVALLPLSPLRTVHATFAAHGSSLIKAPFDKRTRQPMVVSNYVLHRYCGDHLLASVGVGVELMVTS